MSRQPTLTRAVSALVVAVVALTSANVATAPPADAWTEGACTTPSGVTVVVDFHELGGGVSIRCAPGPVGSGFDALTKAGISYQTTVRFSGFLCRIAGRPADDPCIDTSPASAYWSYWLASRGGRWCYSNLGAGARQPPAGTVEGWSFSLNRAAGAAPAPRAAVPAPLPGHSPAPLGRADCDSSIPRQGTPVPTPTTPPAPPPTHAPRSGGALPAPAQDPGGGATAPSAPDPSGAPGPGTTPDDQGAGATEPTDGEVETETEDDGGHPRSADGTGDDDVTPAERSRDQASPDEAASVDLSDDGRSGGGPWGILMASVVTAALVGLAGLTARRRRRAAGTSPVDDGPRS